MLLIGKQICRGRQVQYVLVSRSISRLLAEKKWFIYTEIS